MERRVTAILAADVVGYSRLMESDELRTFARLKQLREQLVNPTVAGCGGRVVKLTSEGKPACSFASLKVTVKPNNGLRTISVTNSSRVYQPDRA